MRLSMLAGQPSGLWPARLARSRCWHRTDIWTDNGRTNENIILPLQAMLCIACGSIKVIDNRLDGVVSALSSHSILACHVFATYFYVIPDVKLSCMSMLNFH